MITLEQIARRKQKIELEEPGCVAGFLYDHDSQLAHREIDGEVFRISMKSDTAFDRESDKSDEK